jgi:peptidoglycan L-alanyl-D-glutamate endopeptidase CwlK
MDLERVIREVQKVLGVTVDGRAGPETWRAIHERIVPKGAVSPQASVDDRSERSIATLRPEVQPYARALVHRTAMDGIRIKVISGLRSYEEQNDLYAQGRTKPGKVVTKARAGYSAHNFGIAFDVGVFEGSSYRGESQKYKAVGALGLDLGLDWGGHWTSFRDEPHFQLRPVWAEGLTGSKMLAELRRRRESLQDFYA